MGIVAYILIKLKPGTAGEVLKVLRSFKEIQRAHMVTGIYDIILEVKVKELKELGNLVAERIHETEGVSSTVTCIVVA
jgi:DNA-binding Lrp family transcriptional regulator